MINEKSIDEAILRMFSGITFPNEPAGLYDPLRYMISIGGKRIRPRLCLTAWALFRDAFTDEVIEPAMALEVFHSFTLMHDDIMDRSPLRRGQPTVWNKWNEDTAILSGDVMLIDAYKRIAKAPAGVLDSVLKLFSDTASGVCEGQQLDMEFENVQEVSMEEYSRMIGLKTAVLLACSAKMGALLAGASEEQCSALYDYGWQLGMAFQVADDLLDAFGDEKVFGKPIGGDILNCKKSWLTVRTCEALSGDSKALADFHRRFAVQAGSDSEKKAKIKDIKEIYIKLGVDAAAREEVARFTALALEAAGRAGLDEERFELLRSFADKLVGRAS